MKKYVLSFVFIIMVVFVVHNSTNAKSDDSDWMQYRFNSSNNPVLEIRSLNLKEQKISTEDELRSTPVVADGKIFVGNHNSGDLSAYDITTGEKLWQNQAPNWIHSEMIYVEGQLFVGYGNRFFQDNGIRGTEESGLLKLNPKTGDVIWNFETEGEVMPTPAFYDGIVYITTGDRHLYGVNPETGKEEWKYNLGSVISMSAPNIKDGILYVGGSNPYKFFAVDLNEKKLKWEQSFELVTSGLDDVPPVVSDKGVVYTTAVQDTENVLSLKEVYKRDGTFATYKQAIKITLGNFINKQPEMKYDHKIYAMDIRTGQIEWENSLGEGAMVPNNKSGAPMLYNDKIFVGSPITKSFYAYDAENGEKLWKYKSHVNKAPPVADDNRVYFTDTKGLVYGFDIESGELLGKKMLGGTLAPSGPILVNDSLIVGSQDKNVYSLPTEDILQANDSVEKNTDLFSYISLVYVLPIIALLAGVAVIIIIIRFGVRMLKR